MLTVVGASSQDAHAASLRAACELLSTASGTVTAVSVSGRWPDSDERSHSLLRVAERLAAAHHLAVVVRLEPGTFDVRFERRGVDGPMEA